MHNRFLQFLLLNIFALSIFGQSSYQKVQHLERVIQYKAQTQDSLFLFESENPFSALAIKSSEEGVYSIRIGSEWKTIPRDEDVSNPTYFISLPSLQTEALLNVPSNSEFDLFAISSGESPTIDESSRTSFTQDCAEPLELILQSDWRAGLAPPNYTRSFHTVSHNIVHHSAGSNANSNYTQVVRDIYLYHTQVNGWSDIGYNYLIAQDGTIYSGRDPDGGSQAAVRGAHFCGANANTLGVCLLGNYETTSPTEPTWQSLQTLLTYQLLNQELDPFDSYNHPLGDIGTIAGHRDGCSTLCPGENVYSQIQSLKGAIQDGIVECLSGPQLSFSADRDFTKVNELVSFTNESNFYDEYRWIFEGGFPAESTNPSPSVTYYVSGVYDVTLIGSKGMQIDTLTKEHFIQVSTFPAQPLVFPNPVSANAELKIDTQDEIEKMELYTMNGKLAGEWVGELEIAIPELKKGIYFLKIYSGSRVYERKLMVEN